jgi:3-(methylthio)propionyl---CoA ligase
MLGAMQDFPLRLPRLIDHAEREHATAEIVTRWADGRISRTHWAGIASDARKCAQMLQKLGIVGSDRVATLAMNHAHHLISWYGTMGLGAILHTVNPRLFSDQIIYIINHAQDRVLLYDAAFAPLVESLKPHLPSVEHFIVFDNDAAVDGFRQRIDAEDGNFTWVDGDERAPAGLCYTSGTTGNPKGVLYEHRSNLLHAMSSVQPDIFDLSARAVMLPIVPMFHANAWGLPFSAATVGAKMVFSAVNDPAVLWQLIRDEGVTHSAGVPTVWIGLFQHLDAHGGDYAKLRHIIIGGSAAPKAMVERFMLAGIRIGHAWGMTETSPIGTCGALPIDWDDMGFEAQIDLTCMQGRVPFGVELRAVDDDDAVLPRDGKSSGRLQVRGPWVLQRYFMDEGGDCVDDASWFDTGDVAIIHPNGIMQITDRAKDVIKSGGEWISSIDLENATMGCLGIAEAAAIGVPHPKWDERPILLVVRNAGALVTEGDVLAYLQGKIAKFWMPDAVIFVDSLPHTATGKLLKRALREEYQDYKLA